jgi:hypothetical protein
MKTDCSRREFLTKSTLEGMAALTIPIAACSEPEQGKAETFDRDMPIKFFPLKFDKLRLKLEAAKRAGYDKAITFEFSHFMSPQSAYLQAGHLYNR